MGIAHKLVAATAMAAAALGSVAGAHAQTVEAVNEVTASHCGTVSESVFGHTVSGGCHGVVTAADVDLTGHVIGIESAALVNCTNTAEVRGNEDGGGKVSDVVFGVGAGGSAGCANVRPCNSESGESHTGTHGDSNSHVWNLTVTEPSPSTAVASVQICLITGQAINECEGALALDVREINEDLGEAVANDDSVPTGAGAFSTHCEITGHYDITEEAGEDIHVNHL